MEVAYKKHINTEKENRVEFLLLNYDYVDGNDYLANLFLKEYGFAVDEKIDGWWYSIIRIHLGDVTYELMWHEDIGNEIYSLNQTEKENEELQQKLEKILLILNKQMDDKHEGD